MLGNRRVAFLADLLAIIEQYSGEKLHDIDIVDVSSGQYHRQSILNWLTSELTTHDSRLARDQAGHLLYGSNSRLREAKSTIGENVATVERESQERVPHDTEDVDDEVKYAPKEPEPPYSDPFDPGPRQTDWDRKHCSNIDSRDCKPFEYPPSTETPKTPNDIVVTYGVDGRAKQRCRGNVEWTTKVTALRNIDRDPPAPLWLTNKEKTATGSIGGRHLRGPVPNISSMAVVARGCQSRYRRLHGRRQGWASVVVLELVRESQEEHTSHLVQEVILSTLRGLPSL